ncbi:MAG: tRNA (N(6)-L-threonylcarbamoyladenosine(37)-C(2))-methylthiotransferase MtaB [Rhabdochlamydiaceae bacterium]|nr:tRNA (N(6)-L-threonylcarbamoyladenosine(37)-C(2))-methylthiotransferase MtaB [Rhabdochlamydiaceae bacterium]
MTSKKFKVVTLGCRTNQYESQAYIDQLKALGYEQAGDGESAELCLVNTCTVTESADHSSRYSVRQLAKQNPGAQIVVTGCAAEKDGKSFLQMAGVSHVVGNQDKENLLPIVFPEEDWPEFAIQNFEAHTRAFVKVQDGCNSFCTYCIIPYVRGRSRSRRLDDILEEIKSLVASGFREIVLTGINIGDFDGAPKEGELPVRLADLVRAVDAVEGVERLRISSIDPDEVDEDLTQAVLNGKHTCPSFHIVLQSGSNVVLKRMNRKYTLQIFLDTVEKLKKAHPDFTFTTDVIVGFPGESEADFQDTLEVMRTVRFAKVHMFPYSPRSKTRAALYPNQIAQDVIQERKKRVLHLAEETSFSLRETYVGREMDVLLESPVKDFPELFSGHTENFLSVWVESGSKTLRSNEIVRVKLIENGKESLRGMII